MICSSFDIFKKDKNRKIFLSLFQILAYRKSTLNILQFSDGCLASSHKKSPSLAELASLKLVLKLILFQKKQQHQKSLREWKNCRLNQQRLQPSVRSPMSWRLAISRENFFVWWINALRIVLCRSLAQYFPSISYTSSCLLPTSCLHFEYSLSDNIRFSLSISIWWKSRLLRRIWKTLPKKSIRKKATKLENLSLSALRCIFRFMPLKFIFSFHSKKKMIRHHHKEVVERNIVAFQCCLAAELKVKKSVSRHKRQIELLTILKSLVTCASYFQHLCFPLRCVAIRTKKLCVYFFLNIKSIFVSRSRLFFFGSSSSHSLRAEETTMLINNQKGKERVTTADEDHKEEIR